MEKFERTLELFLAELKSFAGAVPTVKIDYNKETILVIDCPSGFVKQLHNNKKVCTHLSSKGLKVEYFS